MRNAIDFIADKIVLLIFFAVPIAIAVGLIISFVNQTNEPEETKEPFEVIVEQYPKEEVDRYYFDNYDAVAPEDYDELYDRYTQLKEDYDLLLDKIGEGSEDYSN